MFWDDFIRIMTKATWVAIFTKLAFGTHPSAAVAILIVGAVYAVMKGLIDGLRG